MEEAQFHWNHRYKLLIKIKILYDKVKYVQTVVGCENIT